MKTKRFSRSQRQRSRVELMEQAVDACRTVATLARLLVACGEEWPQKALPAALAADAGAIIHREIVKLRELLPAL